MELTENKDSNILKKPIEEDYDDFLTDFDIAKLLVVTTKSIIWVVLLISVSLSGAILYLRYTKPVYESSSIIKLDSRTQASAIGLGIGGREEGNSFSGNMSALSGEIEVIKSQLVYEKVIKRMDLNVSYFAYGNILYEERYKTSPFFVEYKITNPSFYDRRFDVKITDSSSFSLGYKIGEE